MADYMAATLKIREKDYSPSVQELFAEETFESEEVFDGIIEASDSQATYGEFDELEGKLIELGIPFDRYSEAKYEYPERIRYYRPATSGLEAVDIEVYAHETKPLIYMEDIQKVLDNPHLSADQKIEAIKGEMAKSGAEVPNLEDLCEN